MDPALPMSLASGMVNASSVGFGMGSTSDASALASMLGDDENNPFVSEMDSQRHVQQMQAQLRQFWQEQMEEVSDGKLSAFAYPISRCDYFKQSLSLFLLFKMERLDITSEQGNPFRELVLVWFYLSVLNADFAWFWFSLRIHKTVL
jgi:hypothetical protein